MKPRDKDWEVRRTASLAILAKVREKMVNKAGLERELELKKNLFSNVKNKEVAMDWSDIKKMEFFFNQTFSDGNN